MQFSDMEYGVAPGTFRQQLALPMGGGENAVFMVLLMSEFSDKTVFCLPTGGGYHVPTGCYSPQALHWRHSFMGFIRLLQHSPIAELFKFSTHCYCIESLMFKLYCHCLLSKHKLL